jgi:hypothetical protein
MSEVFTGMSVKVCGECGFPHGPRGLCIARDEAKKTVGYRPGVREPRKQTEQSAPMQMGPQR